MNDNHVEEIEKDELIFKKKSFNHPGPLSSRFFLHISVRKISKAVYANCTSLLQRIDHTLMKVVEE